MGDPKLLLMGIETIDDLTEMEARAELA